MGRRLPMRNRYWTKPPDDSDIAGIPCPCNAFSRGYTPAKASYQDRVAGPHWPGPNAHSHRMRHGGAEPRRLFVVAWLQAGWMIATQIDPFCASPTDRTKGIVPVQNGGSGRLSSSPHGPAAIRTRLMPWWGAARDDLAVHVDHSSCGTAAAWPLVQIEVDKGPGAGPGRGPDSRRTTFEASTKRARAILSVAPVVTACPSTARVERWWSRDASGEAGTRLRRPPPCWPHSSCARRPRSAH
jgi:hypothetical protein